MKRGAALLLLALLSAPALATMNEAQNARYQALIDELRCLVCQNQTIAESNAPLATDLREQVERQILAGRSDEQILNYMTDRYGDFVRYRPPWSPRTLALWSAPLLLVLLGLIMAWRTSRMRSVAAPSPPPDPEAVRKLLEKEHKE